MNEPIPLLMTVMGFGLYGSLVMVPIFLQSLLRYPAFQAGFAMAPRDTGRVGAVLQSAQVDDRRRGHQLPDYERDQADHRRHAERGDQIRGEPIILLPLVEQNLERADAERQEPQTPAVNFFLRTSQVRRVADVELDHQESQQANRHVDVEDPAPGRVVRKPTAHHRSDDRRDDNPQAPESHRLAARLRRERFQEHVLLRAAQRGGRVHCDGQVTSLSVN